MQDRKNGYVLVIRAALRRGFAALFFPDSGLISRGAIAYGGAVSGVTVAIRFNLVLMPATVEPRSSSVSTTGFVDGLGRRSIRFDRELGTTLECLQVRPELRAFEEALLAQACHISELADTRFMRVRSIDQEHGRLVVISELAPGDRLSDIVESRFPGPNPVSTIDAAFGFLLQILPALAKLHTASLLHGVIAPGRVVLTGTGRVILTDTIYGTSLPRLNLSRRRLWQELQVAFPAESRDGGADLAQSAMCALSVALGRPVDVADPLKVWPALIDEAAEIARSRGDENLAAGVKDLFKMLLPLSGSLSRVTVSDALERVREIANGHLGEAECAAALLEFVRYESTARAAAPAAVTASSTLPPAKPALDVVAPAIPEVATPGNIAKEPVVAARSLLGIETASSDTPAPVSTASFADRVRALVQKSPLPWKVAAAAVAVIGILMAVGMAGGGWGSSKGDEKPATAAAASAAAAVPAPKRPAPPLPAPTPTKGVLSVVSQPEGAKVLLDGAEAGLTPLVIPDLAPGRHTVVVSTETVSVKRTVRVEAGKTATVDVPVLSGWVQVRAPIVLDVSEGSKKLGTTEQGRIPLSPGRHTLTLSNRDLSYSSVQSVEVAGGREAVLNVNPTGRVNLNAQPWAEVWIDGARVGETPLANLQVLLGTREFVFKHPQFGERRITAKVSTTPSALSVDFTKSSQRP